MNGLCSEKWGPSFWFVLEQISFAYHPSEYRCTMIINLIESLCDVLPCNKCRIEYKMLLCKISWYDLKYEITKNQITLCAFINDLHNLINVRLKKTCIFTLHEHMHLCREQSKNKRLLEKHVSILLGSIGVNFRHERCAENLSFIRIFYISMNLFIPFIGNMISYHIQNTSHIVHHCHSRLMFSFLTYKMTEEFNLQTYQEFNDHYESFRIH